MSGNDEPKSNFHVRHIFERKFGYFVESIEETPGEAERADLRVCDGVRQYIIEVKERLSETIPLQREFFDDDNGGYSVYTEGPKLADRMKERWKKGKKQLDATPGKERDFKLLFQYAKGDGAEIVIRRAIHEFYGVAKLSPASREDPWVDCIYFNYAAAYRMPRLNGLLLLENRSLSLCLNEFSENYEDFRNSDLVRKMGNAIYDPSNFDDREDTIVYDGDLPRKNETGILDELERKYGKRYRKIEMYRPIFVFDQEKDREREGC